MTLFIEAWHRQETASGKDMARHIVFMSTPSIDIYPNDGTAIDGIPYA
ncbi:hypothetical protein [Rhodanobacter lindaniclasticus]